LPASSGGVIETFAETVGGEPAASFDEEEVRRRTIAGMGQRRCSHLRAIQLSKAARVSSSRATVLADQISFLA
jgi:hypothetical protein